MQRKWSETIPFRINYDGTSGADKNSGGVRAWLTPYYPEPEPTISKKETVQKPQTHLERLNSTFQSYRHTTKLF